MTRALFVYGTLEAPEVVERVVGRRLAGRSARLDDYVRHLIRGQLYPGIVPRAGASTPGTLLLDVEAADLERLDAFEGALYCRARVEVTVEDRADPASRARRDAFTYVVRSECVDLLSDDAWSRERFESDWLPTLLERWRS